MGSGWMFRILTAAVFGCLVAIGLSYRLRAARAGGAVSRRAEGAPVGVLLRLAGLSFWLGLLLYIIHPPWMGWAALPLPAWLRWLGAGLVVAALPGVYWMFRSLSTNLTDTVAVRSEHELITHGPYRWIRHPMYALSVPVFLGFALLCANWFLSVAGLFAVVLLAARTPTEEAKLVEAFGEEYRNYMARTGRFIPRFTGSRGSRPLPRSPRRPG